MHPGVKLGHRAGAALAVRGTIPVVVLVSDPGSYARAIAGWTHESMYPVLIDDGTPAAREDIGRFVRGFRPVSVVHWDAGADSAGGTMRERRAVPNARALADSALAEAWGIDAQAAETMTEAELADAQLARWAELDHTPPGVVLADERDAAWTAGLALAAARGQPIIWAELPSRSIDGSLAPAAAMRLAERLEFSCEQTGLPWRALGDAIDAVTICAGLPARYETGPEAYSATTDRLGRFEDGSRWAWAGQIFGSERQAAYRAMCSIFLGVESAWLFDGYGSSEPWIQWDATAAAEQLKAGGIGVTLDDEPANRLDDWKLRAERPVRADLICINSSGNRTWFDLAGTRAWGGDIPLLETPAALYLVHSWSAVAPGREATIAGRWFERGVFAYAGSVHEPFLQAFVPTPVLAQRVTAGMAFGAAVRVDGGGPWRVAVLGDPLFARGPDSDRLDAQPPLDGTEPLSERLKAAAGAERYHEMYAMLNLLGRDADIARIFEAMLRDKPQALDADVATAAVFALFRAGADDAFLRAYAVLPPDVAGSANAVDALWHVGRRVVRRGGDFREAALSLMASHTRERQAEADAAELQRLGG